MTDFESFKALNRCQRIIYLGQMGQRLQEEDTATEFKEEERVPQLVHLKGLGVYNKPLGPCELEKCSHI